MSVDPCFNSYGGAFMQEYRVEIEKDNITLSAFISLCKQTCKYKNVPFTFDKEKFIAGKRTYIKYYNAKNNEFVSHVHSEEPYKYIDYKKMKDGVKKLECYGFEFDENGKTGSGYFHTYLKNS